MNQDKIDLRIGELLIEAAILSARDLDDAMKTARGTGLPIGRVLVMAGFMTDGAFQAAVQAQSLIRDSIIPVETAVKALQLVAESDITFDEALSKLGWERPEDSESNKLGELLLASETLPPDTLETAMRTSQATGLPLGRLLVSLGTISDQLLSTALVAQTSIRAGRITRQQAIDGLKAAHSRRIPIESLLTEQGYYHGPQRPSIRIGELLVLAGTLSEEEVTAALEQGLVQQRSVGDVLVNTGKIDRFTLHTGLKLQEMISNETLTKKQAAECLARVQSSDIALVEALAFIEVPKEEFKTKVPYHDVLRVAGVIGQPELDKLDNKYSGKPSSLEAIRCAREMLAKQIIDERIFYGSLRCYFLISSGWLSMQQGIIALNYFMHKQVSFDEVLEELRWTVKTHLPFRGEEEEGADAADGGAAVGAEVDGASGSASASSSSDASVPVDRQPEKVARKGKK